MNIWPFKRRIATEQKSLSNPESWLIDLFGASPTEAGIVVSPKTALKVPAVSAAIKVISEAVASLDVRIIKTDEHGAEHTAPDHPVLSLLKGQANDWTSSFEFIRDIVIASLTNDAGGLAHIGKSGDGTPVEIIQYAPGVISVDYDQVTQEPRYRIGTTPAQSSDVIHLKSPFGQSPLTLAREAIALSMVLERHASRLFGRGAKPSGILSFPKGMGQDTVDRAREGWRSVHEGNDAGGRTAILYDGAEFTPITFASTDAQFLENRNFQVIEIARAFRVPPPMLYDLSRATWSNAEQQSKEFLSYTLEPWLRALEGALRRALFSDADRGKYRIHFDREDLSRADLQTRATTINSLVASQVINPNEGRAWLGYPKRDGGDTFLNPNITQSEGDNAA